MKLRGVDLLDGSGWRRGVDLTIVGGRIDRITQTSATPGAPVICPAPIDLQVNGGGGWMLGDCEAPGDVLEILSAHRRLGTAAILPTLISDSPGTTEAIIHLVEAARAADPGILGLHLEGPHLARAGAHDPKVLRDMAAEDMALYGEAKARVDHLMITLAPERVTLEQIKELSEAGIIVSLGHSDCTCEEAEAAFAAGARMATHLFNAMSGLQHRAPGLVGAALTQGEVYGIIADGHHVADAALRVALKAHPTGAIPVSDAMCVAGTDRTEFQLGGRKVQRREGALTLSDGTLAGADASLLTCLRNIANVLDRPLTDVLRMGFDRPHRLLHGTPNTLEEGAPAQILHIDGTQIEGFDGHAWHVLGETG